MATNNPSDFPLLSSSAHEAVQRIQAAAQAVEGKIQIQVFNAPSPSPLLRLYDGKKHLRGFVFDQDVADYLQAVENASPLLLQYIAALEERLRKAESERDEFQALHTGLQRAIDSHTCEGALSAVAKCARAFLDICAEFEDQPPDLAGEHASALYDSLVEAGYLPRAWIKRESAPPSLPPVELPAD